MGEAQAKTIGHYRVNVQIRNRHGGEMMDLATLMMGWSCNTSSEVTYSEAMRDHQGHLKQERPRRRGYRDLPAGPEGPGERLRNREGSVLR
jgi:hypothetical protein